MCPHENGDAPPASTDEMVPIDTSNEPHVAAPGPQTNGHKQADTSNHRAGNKNAYGRASDFLSNTSNWKVSCRSKICVRVGRGRTSGSGEQTEQSLMGV